MAGWHQRFNGHEFEQAQGDLEGQRNLACCSPCRHKESDITEQLKRNSNNIKTKKEKKMLKTLQLIIQAGDKTIEIKSEIVGI